MAHRGAAGAAAALAASLNASWHSKRNASSSAWCPIRRVKADMPNGNHMGHWDEPVRHRRRLACLRPSIAPWCSCCAPIGRLCYISTLRTLPQANALCKDDPRNNGAMGRFFGRGPLPDSVLPPGCSFFSRYEARALGVCREHMAGIEVVEEDGVKVALNLFASE